jgi:renalase
MAAFDGPVPLACDRVTNLRAIGSAVRNSAKPGRTGPEAWVLQANADWSRAHLEDTPDMVEHALLAAFADHIGAASPAVIATSAHRWRYAKTNALDRGAFWNAGIQLGACGDWLLGPRIEAAWLSGHRLASLVGRTGSIAAEGGQLDLPCAVKAPFPA